MDAAVETTTINRNIFPTLMAWKFYNDYPSLPVPLSEHKSRLDDAVF